MSQKLSAEELKAVTETIALIEENGWDSDRKLADMIRSWMKSRL